MGERVRIDDRWRIIIPSKFRRGLKPKDELIIEERGPEIILRKTGRNILNEFNDIKLFTNEELRTSGAERAKHVYGGYKE